MNTIPCHAVAELQMHLGCKPGEALTTKRAVSCIHKLLPKRPDLILVELGAQEFAVAGIGQNSTMLSVLHAEPVVMVWAHTSTTHSLTQLFCCYPC
jgi:hypothetical protein